MTSDARTHSRSIHRAPAQDPCSSFGELPTARRPRAPNPSARARALALGDAAHSNPGGSPLPWPLLIQARQVAQGDAGVSRALVPHTGPPYEWQSQNGPGWALSGGWRGGGGGDRGRGGHTPSCSRARSGRAGASGRSSSTSPTAAGLSDSRDPGAQPDEAGWWGRGEPAERGAGRAGQGGPGASRREEVPAPRFGEVRLRRLRTPPCAPAATIRPDLRARAPRAAARTARGRGR